MKIFCDTETTGLDPDDGEDEIWEFAAVKRDDTLVIPEVASFYIQIEHDVSKAMRLPEPFLSDYLKRYDPARAVTRTRARLMLNDFFQRGPGGQRHQLIGAVPDFDTAGLRHLMQVRRSQSPWHYHITDVETLLVGYLAARGVHVPFPYESDDLSLLVGVDPTLFDRHTAMGDVLWTIANYYAVAGK